LNLAEAERAAPTAAAFGPALLPSVFLVVSASSFCRSFRLHTGCRCPTVRPVRPVSMLLGRRASEDGRLCPAGAFNVQMLPEVQICGLAAGLIGARASSTHLWRPQRLCPGQRQSDDRLQVFGEVTWASCARPSARSIKKTASHERRSVADDSHGLIAASMFFRHRRVVPLTSAQRPSSIPEHGPALAKVLPISFAFSWPARLPSLALPGMSVLSVRCT